MSICPKCGSEEITCVELIAPEELACDSCSYRWSQTALDLSKTQRNLERLEEICKIHVDNRHLLIVERKEASAILAEYEKGKEV